MSDASSRPKRTGSQRETTTTPAGDRVAKVMARAGLCSRRDAERWVEAGRVTLNGKKLTSPAQNVTAADDLRVDGAPVAAHEPPRVWRLNKPAGRITTHHDPQGRPTVFDALPGNLPRVISVGRLDYNTEGLLLLTTSGELARHLELPETGWTRRYRVRVFGHPTSEHTGKLAAGMTVEGVRYAPIEAEVERTQGANAWLTMTLREGKNREIRKVLGALGFEVSRLIRVSYGPFQLGDMKTGAVEEVRRHILRQQLGTSQAERLGLHATKDAAEEKSGRPRRPSRPSSRKPRPASAKPSAARTERADPGSKAKRSPSARTKPSGKKPAASTRKPSNRPAGKTTRKKR
ncbi:MAG: pseudouridine synthase [Pseudomonadota bacterium]